MYLSADAILDADDLKAEPVEVPEWGGTVLVRGMTGAERDRFEASFAADDLKGMSKKGLQDLFRARLAAGCMVDEKGKRLFQGEAVVKRLADKSAIALQRVCDVALRLSAISDADVDDLTKN